MCYSNNIFFISNHGLGPFHPLMHSLCSHFHTGVWKPVRVLFSSYTFIIMLSSLNKLFQSLLGKMTRNRAFYFLVSSLD
jgi:hypothetical protein